MVTRLVFQICFCYPGMTKKAGLPVQCWSVWWTLASNVQGQCNVSQSGGYPTPLLHSPPLPFVSAAEDREGEMLANYPRPRLLPPSVWCWCCSVAREVYSLCMLPIFTTVIVTFFLFKVSSFYIKKSIKMAFSEGNIYAYRLSWLTRRMHSSNDFDCTNSQ